ncbi:MAG: hypothetical protein AB8F94_22920 [Saprospiraceae bacterium]
MKNKKVSNGYWLALAFVSLSLFTNLTNREDDGKIITFNDWLIDKPASSFITIDETKLNTLEAVYFEEKEFGSEEVESRLFFIPMYSSTKESTADDKIQLVYRVSSGEIFDFLVKKLNNSEESMQREILNNPNEFIFEGPFTGGIQNTNKAMRDIQTKMPNLDPDFKVFSSSKSSPQALAIKVLVIAFVILLLIIGYKLFRGSKT